MNSAVERPFGWRDKFGYLFGDFGNDFTFILSSMFLMKFYTDVMGISAEGGKIPAMDSKDVCAGGIVFFFDLSVDVCGFFSGVQDFLDVFYLSALGFIFLYFY